jgi:hypothetical protein
MKALNSGPLCLLLSLLPACGTQLVEFPSDGGKDAPVADTRIADVNSGESRDGPDGAANYDAVNTDGRIPDGGPSDDAPTDGRIADGGIDLAPTDVRIPDGALLDVGDVGIPDVGDVGIPDVGDVGIPDVGDVGIPDSGDSNSACAQAPVVLGSAANFAVLAGSTVTNTGPTMVTIGDLGVSPGSAVTGFPPGIVIGAQHAMDPTSAQAILDLTIAYNNAAGRSLCPISRIGDLGGLTLAPGLYKSTSDMSITTADLTLDAQGDPSAVFIFQIASTLSTTSGRQVLLIGGAKASNVFWQVGTSATLGSTTSFQGTIMADQAITLNTGVKLVGRALARIAAVTLDSNMINTPAP